LLTRLKNHARANVYGLVAVFIALGGTAYALEANSVRSQHIANGQVKSADLKPVAQRAVKPYPGGNANNCAGQSPQVGVFCGDLGGPWSNTSQYVPPHSPAAFDIDNEGMVQIRGLVVQNSLAPHTIFILPRKYRPATKRVFTTTAYYAGDGGHTRARVDISASGAVEIVEGGDLSGFGDWLSLDGITYRAGT
jgi:hypothetical protein